MEQTNKLVYILYNRYKMDIPLSKHITKSKKPFDNADGSYNIEVKYEYCISKSLYSVYDEIKDLFTILFNEKGKFYFKITLHIGALNLNTNKDAIRNIKSYYFLLTSDSYELDNIISSLSYDFNNLASLGYVDVNIFCINVNIFHDFNKVTLNSDSDESV